MPSLGCNSQTFSLTPHPTQKPSSQSPLYNAGSSRLISLPCPVQQLLPVALPRLCPCPSLGYVHGLCRASKSRGRLPPALAVCMCSLHPAPVSGWCVQSRGSTISFLLPAHLAWRPEKGLSMAWGSLLVSLKSVTTCHSRYSAGRRWTAGRESNGAMGASSHTDGFAGVHG